MVTDVINVIGIASELNKNNWEGEFYAAFYKNEYGLGGRCYYVVSYGYGQ
jgi:hypothetical protein